MVKKHQNLVFYNHQGVCISQLRKTTSVFIDWLHQGSFCLRIILTKKEKGCVHGNK